MEVRIGVHNAARDIGFESKSSQDEVAKAISEAIAKGGVLALTDEKGRQYIIPADKIAYVELGESARGRVGFGAS
jgi:hypothetical protein